GFLQGAGDLGLAQTTAGQDAKERFCRQLHDGSSEVIRQVVTPADSGELSIWRGLWHLEASGFSFWFMVLGVTT
ncbi:hypothetical protein, partial [Halomonas sp. Ps84H-12]|uniref:hypothetical protein n=1 Tax=Halomonas sp. Ps84H-12 TaxID=2954501 RepID=UPI0020973A10